MKYLAVIRVVARLSALGLVAAAALSGCSQGVAQQPRSVVTQAQLAPWSGRDSVLFDDRIDRLSLDTGNPTAPASDEFLRQRAQAADNILRVKVLSLTTDQVAQSSVHHLLVAPEGEAVAGRAAGQSTYDLTVGSGNPFFAVLGRMGTKLVGRSFIAYIKHFSGTEGPEVHWFMSAESPEVVAAIREAHLLMEVRASNP
jgi:hypothetical protein